MKPVKEEKIKKDRKNTIFVQIASYRDPQLLPTLKDMIDKAEHPENLRIGICWQHCDKDEWTSWMNLKMIQDLEY
jgi:hypothetical protein